jgi:dTDP-4-amino-4,6-dideoxygalactose transaminase
VLQAEVLRLKLPHLDKWNDRRTEIAGIYRAGLSELPISLPLNVVGREHVYHLYVVELENRDTVKERLSNAGVATGLHYPVPVHLQPGFAYLGHEPGSFPNAEKSADKVLSLPMWPHMTDEQVQTVIDQLKVAISW